MQTSKQKLIRQSNLTDEGRSGNSERPSFLSRKGALTHHLQSRRWYPSLRSGRALFTKHPPDASPEGAANAAEPCRASLPVRLADGCRLICIFAANRCPYLGQPATRLRKPATGSFVAEMDDAIPHRPYSFGCAKRNKNASLQGAERT